MKKNKLYRIILPALCAAPLTTNAATVFEDHNNTVDIYGRVEAKIANGEESFAGDNGTKGDLNGRVGIKFDRALTMYENTSVMGKLEYQIRTQTNDSKLDEGEDLEARYTYAGFKHTEFGSIYFGRTQNPMYNVMKITDKYKNATPNIYNYGISSIDTSYKFNRQDSTLQYDGTFDNHEIKLAYVMGNNENDRLDNAYMASYRLLYKGDNFKITPAIAASQFNRADDNSDTSRKQHNQIMAGIQFDMSGWTLGLTAVSVDIEQDNGEDKYFGIDTLVAYKFDRFKILAGYSFLDEDDQDVLEKEDFRIEGQWHLASKTYLSLTYDQELHAKNKKSDDDAITLGLRYDF